MSSNVGLSTPRGSGTSGYVQRNLSVLKPRDAGVGVPYTLDGNNNRGGPRTRKPDEDILKHDRLREIEVKVLELRDTLEDAGKDEEDIELETDQLREKLTQEMERGSKKGLGAGGSKSRLKSYQVHELAEAKARESERLRRALGLKAGEVAEDGEHPMARQEKRRRKREEEDGDAAAAAAGDDGR